MASGWLTSWPANRSHGHSLALRCARSFWCGVQFSFVGTMLGLLAGHTMTSAQWGRPVSGHNDCLHAIPRPKLGQITWPALQVNATHGPPPTAAPAQTSITPREGYLDKNDPTQGFLQDFTFWGGGVEGLGGGGSSLGVGGSGWIKIKSVKILGGSNWFFWGGVSPPPNGPAGNPATSSKSDQPFKSYVEMHRVFYHMHGAAISSRPIKERGGGYLTDSVCGAGRDLI